MHATKISNLINTDYAVCTAFSCNAEHLDQPRTQGTFRNESTLVDRGHVVSLYCPGAGCIKLLITF